MLAGLTVLLSPIVVSVSHTDWEMGGRRVGRKALTERSRGGDQPLGRRTRWTVRAQEFRSREGRRQKEIQG